MGRLSDEAAGLRALLGRLRTYKVLTWKGTSADPDMKDDRVEVPLGKANVVSSLIATGVARDRHKVVLDIDHPCYLVKSSTPGHFHLYIDVPGGVEWGDYKDLLKALAHCGVVERGYVKASIERGATMVRLPGVKKGENGG